MVQAIYSFYLVGVLGIGGIALLMFNANQSVTQTVVECARKAGAEQNACFAQARALAKANAALAVPIMPELSREGGSVFR